MKKWVMLFCAMTFFVMRAQDESGDTLSQLISDLESTTKSETLGGLLDETTGEEEAQEGPDLLEEVEERGQVVVEEELPEVDEEVFMEQEEEDIDTAALESELDKAFADEMDAMELEEEMEEKQPVRMPDGLSAEDDDIVPTSKPKDVAAPLVLSEELVFDTDEKANAVVKLVERAQKEFQKRPFDVAANRFTHTKEFIEGDLYIFVYDINGTCLAHGDDTHLLWKNLYNLTDWVGTPIVQDIIKVAKAGGGWVTYGWHNATKVSYVQLVEKEGKPYVIGSGFYPHSKKEAVVNLVKGGVALFNKVKKEGRPADWAFSRMSYPSGAFVAGNLYLYTLDFEGNIMAQGDRPGLINSNAWDYKDENGVYVNREIVKKLKTSTDGVWVDYMSKRALKKAYAEKVKDKEGKEYFIACGYYPDANREQTVDLVRKAYQFMKTHGKTNSVEEFSSRRSNDFRYGDLFIKVFDLRGRVIADGGNADNIGRRMLDAKDEDGFEYIKSMLKRATKQGIWVNAKIKGSFQSMFAQKIDLGIGQYVIMSSYYPVSKSETMILLVQSGASFLLANPREKAFGDFVKQSGKFRRGDLELVVVDTSGLCYAYGNDYDLIWRNIFDIKDETGKPFIKAFINESQHGSIMVRTHMNNATKFNYVTSVEKDGKTYVISSGFYQ